MVWKLHCCMSSVWVHWKRSEIRKKIREFFRIFESFQWNPNLKAWLHMVWILKAALLHIFCLGSLKAFKNPVNFRIFPENIIHVLFVFNRGLNFYGYKIITLLKFFIDSVKFEIGFVIYLAAQNLIIRHATYVFHVEKTSM